MTTFINCADTDLLWQHDVYRLTIIPGSHLLSLLEPDAIKSAELSYGMQGLYDAGALGNIIPLFTNPYKTGDLAETVDILVMSDGGNVATLLNNVLGAANAPEFADVSIQSCEQVVGLKSAPVGTDTAEAAVYSPAAAGARTSDASAAASAVGNSWLTSLENDLGVAGKYVVFGALGLAAVWLYGQYKTARRITG